MSVDNDEKFKNALGLCRRAGKLALGHTDVKFSLRKNKANLVLLSSDSSERLKEEIINLAGETQCILLNKTMFDLAEIIGQQVGVIAVNDKNLSVLVRNSLDQ